MTRDHDPGFDPRVADWLETDPRQAPGPVLETVLGAVPLIPQRRHAPWRHQLMHRTALLGAAAVALIAVGLAGLAMATGLTGPNVGTVPSPTHPAAVSPSKAPRLGIPPGTYASNVLQAAAIVDAIQRDPTLDALQKTTVIDGTLGIADDTTFQIVIEVDGDRFIPGLRHDGRPAEIDDTWHLAVVDSQSLDLTIPCCGKQRYRIDWDGPSFSLTPVTPTGTVESVVRRVLFQSSPFSPVP
jgi:hypothetical protein